MELTLARTCLQTVCTLSRDTKHTYENLTSSTTQKLIIRQTARILLISIRSFYRDRVRTNSHWQSVINPTFNCRELIIRGEWNDHVRVACQRGQRDLNIIVTWLRRDDEFEIVCVLFFGSAILGKGFCQDIHGVGGVPFYRETCLVCWDEFVKVDKDKVCSIVFEIRICSLNQNVSIIWSKHRFLQTRYLIHTHTKLNSSCKLRQNYINVTNFISKHTWRKLIQNRLISIL